MSAVDAFKMWEDAIGATTTTMRKYRGHFKDFCRHMGLDPSNPTESANAFYRQRFADLKCDDPATRFRFENLAERYYKHLLGQTEWTDGHKHTEFAPKSALQGFAAIRSFFKHMRMRLECNIRIKEAVVRREKVPTPRELGEMLKFADVRGKAAIAIQASTGGRETAIARLTFGDVEGLDYPEEPATVWFPLAEEGMKDEGQSRAFGFLAEFAKQLVREYRQFRQMRYGEEITETSPLIAKEGGFQPINGSTINEIVVNAALESGVGTGHTRNGRKEYDLTSHKLRKYVYTQLELANKMNPTQIDRVTQHKSPGIRSVYSRADILKLKQLFKESEPWLTPEGYGISVTMPATIRQEFERLFKEGMKEFFVRLMEKNSSRLLQARFNIKEISDIVEKLFNEPRKQPLAIVRSCRN